MSQQPQEKAIKFFRCCVDGCDTKGSTGFFGFPTNETLAMKWIKATKTFHLNDDCVEQQKRLYQKRFTKVCKNHFDSNALSTNAIGQVRLAPNTYPTCFLPDPLTLKSEHNYTYNTEIMEPPRKYRCLMKPENSTNECMRQCTIEAAVDPNGETEMIYIPPDFSTTKRATEVDIGNGNEIWFDVEMENINVESNFVNDTDEKAKVTARLPRFNIRKLNLQRRRVKGNKLNVDKVLQFLSKRFKKQQYEFFKMQLLNCGKKNHGQRYTDEQKNVSLAIYKHSPKTYRFMQRIFTLPSKKTLGRHSAHLVFEAGIDAKFFEHLKKRVENLAEIDKLCTIGWDEVSLQAHLDYSPTRDAIDGFVELANTRRPDFATHSLNFMVRGINMQYKQAVSHFYTSGITSLELAELIKLVSEAVLDTGLVIIGSVCDQTGINVAAVHIRIDPTCPLKSPNGELLSYKIRDNVIIHCYDPPHLIKVLRNNLIKKDLIHSLTRRWNPSDLKNSHSKQTQCASWDHITELYNIDRQASYRRLPKINN